MKHKYVLTTLALLVVEVIGLTPIASTQINDKKAEDRARSIVAKMSLEDKIDLLSGNALFTTRPMDKYGIPSFLMTDGPSGARIPPPSTAYAAGIGLAATWDRQLADEMGVQLARDARSRGASFLLGPGVNLYRAPMNGRNYEYFGEDPYLAANIAVNYITGVQSQGVSATVKHYAANNSEFARMTENSVVDEHALRELYLFSFEAAVKDAHVGAVMDSYNLLNGTYATASSFLNQQVLRKDWGFDGLLMSDWNATHDGVAAAKAGLDLEMPTGDFMNKEKLLPAIKEGKLTVEEVDLKLVHLLTVAAHYGWLDHPVLDTTIPRYNLEGVAITKRSAEEGMVLLKNEDHLLPLDSKKIKRVAVIGPDAYPAIPTAGGSGDVPTFTQSSIMTALADQLKGKATVTWAPGVRTLSYLSGTTAFHTTSGGRIPGVTVETFASNTFEGTPTATHVEAAMTFGKPFFTGSEMLNMYNNMSIMQIVSYINQHDKNFYRWTGYLTVKEDEDYTFFVQNPGKFKMLLDDKVILDESELHRTTLEQAHLKLTAGEHKVTLLALGGQELGTYYFRTGAQPTKRLVEAEAVRLAKEADVVILCLGYNPEIESESMDRSYDLPTGQVELVRQISAANPNVVATIISGGSTNVSPWLGEVKSLVELWYPGQEGGAAFARVATGEVNPSGKLPISWEDQLSDNPSINNYYFNDPSHPADIDYREGVMTGYRGYDQSGKKPLFPFGFGLSYTSFELSDLKASSSEEGATVTFRVKNTGQVSGSTVPQIYLQTGVAGEPIKTLVGFDRVALSAGQEKQITLKLPQRAFTHFDEKTKVWKAAAGSYKILLGASSAEIVTQTSIKLPHDITLPLSSDPMIPIAAKE